MAYIEILRPVNCAMAAVAVVLGALLVNATGGALAIAALSAFLITGAGMVVNDYFDVRIDRINRPQRPIPSGRVSLRNAAIYSGALFGTGIGLTFALNPYMFGLAVFNSALEIVYAWKLKKTPFLGNVLVSWLVASTYIFGGMVSVPGKLGILFQLVPVVLFAIVAFLGNLARELYKTAADYKGDKRERARTVAVLFGPPFAKRLGDVFVVVSSLSSLLVYILGILGIAYLVVQMASIAVYVSCVFLKPEEAEKRTKLGMVIGLVAIAAGLAVPWY
ncbi:MAG: geranylgeranylglycerol-phosphate geranylgeranyltransferase [Candidatus Aenigmatarchaeota archaeon]|nr:MAG: geranylgeranylglycerol-phosphate geranylgeranyltransferase [Candidatus Aenigmarchaeota archaeon]